MERLLYKTNRASIWLFAAIATLAIGTFYKTYVKTDETTLGVITYEQAKEIARDVVNEKKENVLHLLDLDNEKWEEAKKTLQPGYTEPVNIDHNCFVKKEKMSPEIKQSVHNVLENPDVKSAFGITSIAEEDFKIKATRENGKNIYFVLSTPSQINSWAASSEKTVYIVPEEMKRLSISSSELEASIGHELGHILSEHNLEDQWLMSEYKKNLKAKDSVAFQSALNEWRRAQEVEADIVGTFNNGDWANALAASFQNNQRQIASYQLDPSHPPTSDRINYLTTLYSTAQQKADKNELPETIIETIKQAASPMKIA